MFGLEFMCESMMAVFKYLKYCHKEKGPYFLRNVSEEETRPTDKSYSKPFQVNVKTGTNLFICLQAISAQCQETLTNGMGQKMSEFPVTCRIQA